MKTQLKFLLFMPLALITLLSCNNGSGGDEPKDPSGTFSANLIRPYGYTLDIGTGASDKYHPKSVVGELHWTTPDDIIVRDAEQQDVYVPDEDRYYNIECGITICNAGEASGLWDVVGAPSTGWVERMACEEGHGYILRIKYHTVRWIEEGTPGDYGQVNPGDHGYVEGVVYARIYVENHLYDDGAPDGIKVRMQYPFTPKQVK